ncbi:MAG: ASCH domain-containing protein [Thermoprotei archaeon]|nr:MAG: ASCH domain-containing protein [Thermoprotei archaeon]
MPRPLMFSRKYLAELLRGSKTCTIRLGNIKYRVGDTVLVYCGGLVLGRVRITGIERKKLIDLTEEDAKLDGFSSLYELLKALRQHYPNIRANTPVTVIRFEWIEKFDAPLSDSEYSWRYEETPVEVARLALEKLNDLSWEERTVLEVFVKSGSVRAAARKLGGLSLRPLVRGVLRRAAEKLAERGLIKRR